jgi:hypothetical protein
MHEKLCGLDYAICTATGCTQCSRRMLINHSSQIVTKSPQAVHAPCMTPCHTSAALCAQTPQQGFTLSAFTQADDLAHEVAPTARLPNITGLI